MANLDIVANSGGGGVSDPHPRPADRQTKLSSVVPHAGSTSPHSQTETVKQDSDMRKHPPALGFLNFYNYMDNYTDRASGTKALKKLLANPGALKTLLSKINKAKSDSGLQLNEKELRAMGFDKQAARTLKRFLPTPEGKDMLRNLAHDNHKPKFDQLIKDMNDCKSVEGKKSVINNFCNDMMKWVTETGEKAINNDELKKLKICDNQCESLAKAIMERDGEELIKIFFKVITSQEFLTLMAMLLALGLLFVI